MNIFVAKLSPTTTSEDLQELFGEYGQVVSAKVIFDKITGESKRFGFVEMKNSNEAQKAIDELDQCEYDNSTIVVKVAVPKTETDNKKGGNRRFDRNKRF
jgi:RNA recognition motif-containing protein